MKQVILATTLVAVVSTGAHADAFTKWFTHDIPAASQVVKKALDPHKNGVIKLGNGGYSSWKARRRACLAQKISEYDSQTGACKVYKSRYKMRSRVYTLSEHIGRFK